MSDIKKIHAEWLAQRAADPALKPPVTAQYILQLIKQRKDPDYQLIRKYLSAEQADEIWDFLEFQQLWHSDPYAE